MEREIVGMRAYLQREYIIKVIKSIPRFESNTGANTSCRLVHKEADTTSIEFLYHVTLAGCAEVTLLQV